MTRNAIVLARPATRLRNDFAARIPAFAALTATFGAMFNGLDNAFGNAILCAAFAILVAVAIPVLAPRSSFWRAIAPGFALLIAAALWAAISSFGMFGAPALVPDLALSELTGLAGVGAALLAGAAIGADTQRRDRTVDLLIALATAIAAIGLIASHFSITLSTTLWQPGQQGRFAGTFGNANVAGSFYAAIATLAFGRAIGTIGQRTRSRADATRTGLLAARGIACVILLAACAATASRTAMATGIVAILAIGLIHGIRSGHLPRHLLAAGIVVAALLGLVLLVTADMLFERMETLADDGVFRGEMWTHYGRIAARSPIFGYGLGAFQTVNLRNLSDPGLAAELWSVNAAHNIVIQIAIEAGLPYLLLVIGAVLTIGRSVVGAARRGGIRIADLGLGLAAAVILANAMVDIALDVPAIATLFWLMLGLLWGTALTVSDRAAGPPASATGTAHMPVSRA